MAFALHLVPSKAPKSSHPLQIHSQKRAFCPAKPFQFKHHDRLPTSHSALWRIHSGYVRTLTWGADGESIPLGFWSVGDIVGEAIAQTSSYEAQCLGPVVAEALGSTYAFSQSVLLAQVQQSNELLRIVHCRQTERSLLQFLCWLAQRFGQPTYAGVKLPVKLIHQDIADAIGATRVTVTRLLKKLERDGKIQWSVQEKMIYKSTLAQFTLDIDYQLTI